MARAAAPVRQSGRQRCAIYTRKSSEEGLEQAFNSLHAQREACEAYILSQRHEGWLVLPQLYDDGGFSGGTMERPALQQLLAAIEAGRIDVVVVYKVDRLTRALADFAKLVEVFDRHQVSFVSITQQFNTTTSMGRLTLNVLLSFAQFEREVIGERIRDKIAASKRKGMWMGGQPPLGYDVRDRKLVVNHAEAKTVVTIFQRYTSTRSVRVLRDELARAGVVSKQRRRSDGSTYGGQSFGRGALYAMLRNRLYLGNITHKGEVYAGEHPAIIEQALWDEVQALLARNQDERGRRPNATHSNLLCGVLFDEAGHRLTPTYAVRSGKQYRYYVSAALLRGGASSSTGWRIPAADLDTIVIGKLSAFLRNAGTLLDALDLEGTDRASSQVLIAGGQTLAEALGSMSIPKAASLLKTLQCCVTVRPGQVDLSFSQACLMSRLCENMPDRSPRTSLDERRDETITLSVAAQLRRAGKAMRLLVDDAPERRSPDPSLVRLLARAYEVQDRLGRDPSLSVREVAEQENVTSSYLYTLLRLRWLAPDIVTAVLQGQQPAALTATSLMRHAYHLPVAWSEQRVLLGFN